MVGFPDGELGREDGILLVGVLRVKGKGGCLRENAKTYILKLSCIKTVVLPCG